MSDAEIADLLARLEGRPCAVVAEDHRRVYLSRRVHSLRAEDGCVYGEHDWVTPEHERPDELTDGIAISTDCLVVRGEAVGDAYFRWWLVFDKDRVERSLAGDHLWASAFLAEVNPFDPQPTFTSDLLRVRPLKPDDWDALYAVAADPLIWEQHPANDRWQEPVFRAFFRDALASGGALLVTDRATDAVIGSSRFHGYDAGRGEVEIGWTFLARSHWGGRYNGDLKTMMLHHAFRFADAVIFRIGPNNRRSRRAVEKIGGVLSGTSVGADGRESVVYRLTRWEYLSRFG